LGILKIRPPRVLVRENGEHLIKCHGLRLDLYGDCVMGRRVLFIGVAFLFLTAPLRAGVDALDEVNAARAARGLKPFIKDPFLTAGAINVADFRAAWLMAGHTGNDFAGLPARCAANAAGCAAWEPLWGWGACCTYENWTYAGAAWAMGRDGRRYMQLFVR
jgi:hypothetical protein